MSGRDATCAERIEAHAEGRLADFRDLANVADEYAATMMPGYPDRNRLEELAIDPDAKAEDRAEQARESMYEYPLGVSARTVFRIELSTGGPADWLEVFCSGDTPNYEPAEDGAHYEPERIVYHFADWFDHADRALEGDEFEVAERFARTVVPELVE